MKIVLIGASGFLGRHVAQALAVAGHDCVIVTRQVARRRDLKLIPRARVVQANVYDPAELRVHLQGAGAVVSMAGILNEQGFDGSGFHRVHVELVAGLLEACAAAGTRRVLHVSALNAGQGESHYLKTKGEAEQLLVASGMEVTIFQPSVIFGPGDKFFNRFADLLKFSPLLPLACPKAMMQPVYVNDVAHVVAASLLDDSTPGQVLELGGPRVYSLQELVVFTARVMGLSRWTPGLPDLLSRLQGRVMDLVPGKPFSTDNYRSLQVDNVTSRNALPTFGIRPGGIESIVPGYLGVSAHQRRLAEIRRRGPLD